MPLHPSPKYGFFLTVIHGVTLHLFLISESSEVLSDLSVIHLIPCCQCRGHELGQRQIFPWIIKFCYRNDRFLITSCGVVWDSCLPTYTRTIRHLLPKRERVIAIWILGKNTIVPCLSHLYLSRVLNFCARRHAFLLVYKSLDFLSSVMLGHRTTSVSAWRPRSQSRCAAFSTSHPQHVYPGVRSDVLRSALPQGWQLQLPPPPRLHKYVSEFL